MILGPVLTHRAGGDDKAGNAYYVGSVLGLPNATEQDYPQVWAYAEMRRSARVASVRYLPIVWKSRLAKHAEPERFAYKAARFFPAALCPEQRYWGTAAIRHRLLEVQPTRTRANRQ